MTAHLEKPTEESVSCQNGEMDTDTWRQPPQGVPGPHLCRPDPEPCRCARKHGSRVWSVGATGTSDDEEGTWTGGR